MKYELQKTMEGYAGRKEFCALPLLLKESIRSMFARWILQLYIRFSRTRLHMVSSSLASLWSTLLTERYSLSFGSVLDVLTVTEQPPCNSDFNISFPTCCTSMSTANRETYIEGKSSLVMFPSVDI